MKTLQADDDRSLMRRNAAVVLKDYCATRTRWHTPPDKKRLARIMRTSLALVWQTHQANADMWSRSGVLDQRADR